VFVRPGSWDLGNFTANLVVAIGKGHRPPTPEGVISYVYRQLADGGYVGRWKD